MDRIIVVSGNYIDGHAQGAEQVAEAFIFCPAAAIYTVSSDEYDIRGGWKTGEVDAGGSQRRD